MPAVSSEHNAAPRAGRFEILGAWLRIWTPPRGVAIPPVPWRRIALLGTTTALLFGGLAVWLIPRIDEAKQRELARQRHATAVLTAQERQRLELEQRLHTGTASGLPAARTPGGRRQRTRALLLRLASAITADARARALIGTLRGPIETTTCQPFGLGGYECVAVTARIPSTAASARGVLGYPFWARIDPRAGSYVWCKINPRPGEQALGTQQASVALPAACDLQRKAGS